MPSVTEIQLQPGEVLYREGDTNDCAFVVASGEVILFSGGETRVECERRGTGSIVGELSILTGQPRTVSVEAVTPCIVYKISAAKILEMFEGLDPVLRSCIETSISFTGHFTQKSTCTDAPFAPSTLRNSEELIEQFRFELDIARGLKEGQFSMAYQPIVKMSDGSVVGFEALMRWHHETHGMVPPDRFIKVAEAMGSIGRLTEFAISETCATLQRIRHETSADHLFASVNVSGQDIDREGFVDFLAHAIDAHELHPSCLKLEVTETALVPNSAQAVQNLDGIRSLGCGISVDDFGTGYSNFAYLKTLPLTALKIDRAFVTDAHEDAVSRSIVRMLVGFGRELDVDIVAEGLETQEDVNVLRGLGCQYAQGYHFFRPAPEDALLACLTGAPRSVVA